MRILIPVLVLLVAGAAAWLLLGEGDAPESVGALEHDDATETRLPTLASRAREAGREPGRATAGEPMAPFLAPGLPPWGLEVRLRPGSEDRPDACASVEVEALLVGPDEEILWSARAETGDAGRCRIGPIQLPDVPRRMRGAARLEVRVHSQEQRTSFWARNPAELARGIQAIEGDGVRWLVAGLTLRRARLLRGRILTATGHPACGIPVDTHPFYGLVDTGWDGRFALEVGHDDTVFIASMGGTFELDWRPPIPSDLSPSAEHEFTLPDERHLSGRVLDLQGSPLGGIQLVLAESSWSPNGSLVWYRHHHFRLAAYRERLHTRSASDGTFAFPALKRGEPYVLWWPGDDDRWHRYDRDLHADDAGVEIRLERHRFVVQLVDARTKLRVHGTHVVTPMRDGMQHRSLRFDEAEPKEEGRIAAPGDRFRIVGWARGYGLVDVEYAMPPEPGVHVARVEVPPLVPGSRVHIRCLDQEGRPLGPVPLRFRRLLDGKRRAFVLPVATSSEPDGHVTHELPPGPVDVRTPENLGHPDNPRWRFTLDTRATVEVPASGETTQDLTCRQGGAFRLALDAPGGSRARTGAVEVEGPSGQSPNVWWYEAEADGSFDLEMRGDDSWPPDGKVFESQAFEAGLWVLRVAGGKHWRDAERRVRLEPGRVTELRILLQPR